MPLHTASIACSTATNKLFESFTFKLIPLHTASNVCSTATNKQFESFIFKLYTSKISLN